MKIAIFHDYFRVIGGAEKLVLIMAENLGADIITSEADLDIIAEAGFNKIKIISLGEKSFFSNLAPALCRKRFSECDFSKQYDFFIFSGNFSIYATKKHTPNLWYCHTPLRGLYDLKNEKSK
ncbi:MAG: hypothetical protein A2599_03205 [Candidatus Staskawiczbacteria bacterium RIFOXYD1_FULL_39_28]|uniref:Glycosyltransferase subfamily 4-like N-terminal domain-containing protein n=1 Tax=Candidatus Staskawiczbacteria bacterium RIFOXYC1_FULL_38_18 TaxID=1802229 RepID=A0A1G2JDB2_9BACT|nr:MAG: hypothetical protein A2401_03360 [Candidatus Staskawiczbacteria bacterium RIFOXYC1_FULL_38_18]OGZ90300.1 MAG: hypothetical protein A2599_03205 [Candidatus Staskawiczbacteria bacterium RIFOXYD1_FULL_39_28]